MVGQDEVLLVGVFLQDPPPKQVSLSLTDLKTQLKNSIFAVTCFDLCSLSTLQDEKVYGVQDVLQVTRQIIAIKNKSE